MTRINTNVVAMTAIAQLGRNNLDLNTRLQRLSTGLRINRGKDDPAGLIASETLRAEIRAVSQAVTNSQRVINVISTGEGALNEVSSLLLDLRSLLLSSANEGALTAAEIDANQLEIDSLLQSVDRIAQTTAFGGKKLFSGNLDYRLANVDQTSIASVQTYSARVPEGANVDVVVQVTGSAQTAQLTYIEPVATTGLSGAATIELAGAKGVESLSFASGTSVANIVTAINALASVTGVSAVLSTAASNSVGAILMNSNEFGSAQFVSVKALSGTTFVSTTVGETVRDDGQDVSALINGQLANTDGLRVDVRTASLDTRLFLTQLAATVVSSTTYTITGGGARFQITPEVTTNGQVSIGFNSVTTGNLGNAVIGFLNSLRSGGANEIAQGNFIAAERIISDSINQIASQRGRLGGLQKNQIETNINSQQVQLENVTAAESSIRDADMAAEISAMTRAQILVQSTQLTLQIANQQPQAVLQLLG